MRQLATQPTAERAADAGPAIRASRRSWAGAALGLSVAAIYLTYLGLLRNTFFFFDDFLWFHQAATMPLDLRYLRRLNYTHFAPITRVAYLAYHGLFGLTWPPATFVIAGLVVACTVAVRALSRELGADPRWSLGAAVFVAASPVLVHLSQWWGGSIHVLGGLLGTTWTAIEFLRWQRTGGRRHYVLSLVALVSGLLVQERPLLVVAAIGWFGLFPPALGWIRQPIRRALAAAAPHVVIGVGYLVFFTWQYPSVPGERPPLNLLVRFLARGAIRNFGPLTVGLQPSHLGATAVPVGAAVLAGWIALGARRWRRPDVWRSAGLIVGMWIANFGILAYGRIGLFGSAITDDLQYHVDALVWFVAPVAALLSRSLSARAADPSGGADVGDSTRSFRWRPGVVIAGLAAVAIAGFGWPSMLSHDSWAYYGRSERGYMRPVAAGVDALRERRDRFDLLPLGVPSMIFPDWVPLDQRQLVGMFAPAPTPAPGSPQKFGFDTYGRLRPIQPAYTSIVLFDHRGPPAQAAKGLTAQRANVAFEDRGACVTGTSPDSVIQVTVPNADSRPTMLELAYQADRSYDVAYSARNDAGTVTQMAAVPQASGRWVEVLPFRSVGGSTVISLTGPPPSSTTCIQRIALVVGVAQPVKVDPQCEQVGPRGELSAWPDCGSRWYDFS